MHFAGYIGHVPTLDEVVFDPKLTTTIYDIKGRTIATLYIKNHVPGQAKRSTANIDRCVFSRGRWDFTVTADLTCPASLRRVIDY